MNVNLDQHINRAEADRRRWIAQQARPATASHRNPLLATALVALALGWGAGVLCGMGVA